MSDDPITPCTSCGTELPRSEMFGLEPDLQCPECAQDIRVRTFVRFRPLAKDRKPVVTMSIIGLSALLFFLEHIVLGAKGSTQGLGRVFFFHLHMGPWLWSGDVLSLFSTIFMHGGWIHIIFNMWWCWELGRALESGFGRLALIGVVLGGGAFAGGVEWIVNGGAVGFSGALYALAFFLYVHRRTNPHAAAIMNQRTANFLGMWFVLCILLTMAGTWRIANWAHGAGLVWGWLCGEASLHQGRRIRVAVLAICTAAFVALLPFFALGGQAKARQADVALRQQKADASRVERWILYWSIRSRTPKEAESPDEPG